MKIQENISLKDFNTFKIDCIARYFFVVKNIEDLLFIINFIKNKSLNIENNKLELEQKKENNIFRYIFLGSGSNILFNTTKDNNIFDGLIIKNEINFLNILENKKEEVELKKDEVFLEVGSGYEWDSFVKYCCEYGYYGLENLSHIPGTVGAAPVQNIGAYGAEVSDYITEVKCIDILESIRYNKIIEKVFTNLECKFAYRDSIFKKINNKNKESKYENKNKKEHRDVNQELFISSVTFRLSKIKKLNLEYKDMQNYILENYIKGNLENGFESKNLTLLQVRDIMINIRNRKMPNWRDKNSLGTAGSFFKNIIISEGEYEKLLSKDFENKIEEELYKNIPAYKTEVKENKTENKENLKIYYKLSSGYIIDKILGMKNMREGDAGTFENQALIIVNYARATGEEVFNFSEKIIQKCFEVTGLTLEREVNII